VFGCAGGVKDQGELVGGPDQPDGACDSSWSPSLSARSTPAVGTSASSGRPSRCWNGLPLAASKR